MVEAPAADRMVVEHGTGEPAADRHIDGGGDAVDGDRRRAIDRRAVAELAIVVRAPALHAAVVQHGTGAGVAHAQGGRGGDPGDGHRDGAERPRAAGAQLALVVRAPAAHAAVRHERTRQSAAHHDIDERRCRSPHRRAMPGGRSDQCHEGDGGAEGPADLSSAAGGHRITTRASKSIRGRPTVPTATNVTVCVARVGPVRLVDELPPADAPPGVEPANQSSVHVHVDLTAKLTGDSDEPDGPAGEAVADRRARGPRVPGRAVEQVVVQARRPRPAVHER